MNPILFYDDECGLCNSAVRFVIRHNKRGHVLFAPLNGKTAKMHNILWRGSVVFLSNGTQYTRSRALFAICWELGGVWKVAGLLSFFPTLLLKPYDWLYDFIAKRRKSFCYHPYTCTKGEKPPYQRFLP